MVSSCALNVFKLVQLAIGSQQPVYVSSIFYVCIWLDGCMDSAAAAIFSVARHCLTWALSFFFFYFLHSPEPKLKIHTGGHAYTTPMSITGLCTYSSTSANFGRRLVYQILTHTYAWVISLQQQKQRGPAAMTIDTTYIVIYVVVYYAQVLENIILSHNLNQVALKATLNLN